MCVSGAQAINNVNPTQHQPAWAGKQLRPWAKEWSRWAPSQGWGCVTEPGVLPDELGALPDELGALPSAAAIRHPAPLHPTGVSMLSGGRGKAKWEGTRVSFSQGKVNFWNTPGANSWVPSAL